VGNVMERRIIFECHIFSFIIRIESDNCMREIIFHNSLVTYKDFLNFIFSFEGLKPYVFGEMINKNNIIFEIIC
jgi:hypothetical protein